MPDVVLDGGKTAHRSMNQELLAVQIGLSWQRSAVRVFVHFGVPCYRQYEGSKGCVVMFVDVVVVELVVRVLCESR